MYMSTIYIQSVETLQKTILYCLNMAKMKQKNNTFAKLSLILYNTENCTIFVDITLQISYARLVDRNKSSKKYLKQNPRILLNKSYCMIKRSENNIILYKRDQRFRHGTTNGSGFGEVERRKLINDNFFLLVHKKDFF